MEDILDKILKKIKIICVKYKTLVIFGTILSIIVYWIWYINQDEEIQNISNYAISSTTGTKTVDIIVHIDGEIQVPGVYTLKDGARLNELIQIAGGFTVEANTNDINLAQKLKDGIKIYIPKIGEEVKEDIIKDSEYTIKNSKININEASIEELITLPGIGEATANKIITYIRENGRFNSTEEIMNVSGIGNAKYEKIKELIEVN